MQLIVVASGRYFLSFENLTLVITRVTYSIERMRSLCCLFALAASWLASKVNKYSIASCVFPLNQPLLCSALCC